MVASRSCFLSGNPDEFEVFHEGFEPQKVKPFKITERSASRKRTPLSEQAMPETPAFDSRMTL